MGRNLTTHGSYKAVKEAVPIVEIAARYTELEQLGSGKAWYTGRCPLPDHEDQDPSFYIYPDNRWYCFGCDRYGDVINLHLYCGNFGAMWEAMIDLALDYKVELPQRPQTWFDRQRRQSPVRAGIERVRINILRRRLFRFCILPIIDATASDEHERREEVRRAWKDFQTVPVKMLLNRCEEAA